MKKGFLKKILALALVGVMTMPFMAACGGDETPDNGGNNGGANTDINGGNNNNGGGNNNGNGGGSADMNQNVGTRTELSFSFYQAGYGDGWVRESVENFERKYPQYKINYTGNASMFETLKTELENDDCDDDIVLIADDVYTSLASTGKLADLTDMMDMQLPDSSATVRSIIPDAHYEYRNAGGKQYGLPWQENPAAGIVYNKTMFDYLGIEIPETMEDYWEVCEAISWLDENCDGDATNDVNPLVYGGAQQYGYLPNVLNQWFLEDVGAEYMRDFLRYEDVYQFDETEDTRLKVYETLATMLNGVTSTNLRYTSTYASNYSVSDAQRDFINGKAAMLVCGSWFPTETSATLNGANNSDFEYGFFGIPHVNASKKDKTGAIDTSNVRYSYNSNVLAIPASSTKKEAAKLFLLELYSNENMDAFVKNNMGLTRPTTLPTQDVVFTHTDSRVSSFAAQAYAYYKGSAAKPATLVYSLTKKKAASVVAPCTTKNPAATGGDTLQALISATSLAQALTIAATDAANETGYVYNYWDEGAGDWVEEYRG